MPRRPAVEMHPVVRRFVEDAGSLSQSFGIGRVLGQIYAYLYFSPQARNLADLQEALGISKGSASMGVRQLEQWGAVRQVWVKGDRKDYYEASDWFGRILKSVVTEIVGKRLSASTALLGELSDEIRRAPAGDEQLQFVADRIEHLRRFHGRAQKIWNSPIVKVLLK